MTTLIGLVPRLAGLGGMVSFQSRLIHQLEQRSIAWTFELDDPGITSILVIGGTRQLLSLWQARRRGVRIVQRLNGMNWLHKVEPTRMRAALRAELNNRLLNFIRNHLADDIVYQSEFSRHWWEQVFGLTGKPNTVVYNGVDLDTYTPHGPEQPPSEHYRLLLVEGRLTGAYARGLDTAVRLAQMLADQHQLPLELMVVGDVDGNLRRQMLTLAPNVPITWQGIVPRDAIPALDRSAHLLFSADLNAACPNSVIEALACGLPVAAYDTGALGELIQDGAGAVVPYGADYWRLEDPQIAPLAAACKAILLDNLPYRQAARKRAESAFSVNTMVDGYLEVLV